MAEIDDETIKELVDELMTDMNRFSGIQDIPALSSSEKGIKHDSGKPKMSILTWESLNAEARAFEYGANKYKDKHNYKKGMEWSRILDAAMRHIVAFSNKEEFDSESGLNHLWHAKACLAMLIYYYEKKVGQDDR